MIMRPEQDAQPTLKTYLKGFCLALLLAVVPVLLTRLFGEAPVAGGLSVVRSAEYRRELRSYVWGVTLAFGLTGAPFALVYWSALPQFWLFVAIGLFALIQIVVHIRFFLHVDPPRQKLDDLHLMLFSTLILVLMVGGSIWILANLAARMH